MNRKGKRGKETISIQQEPTLKNSSKNFNERTFATVLGARPRTNHAESVSKINKEIANKNPEENLRNRQERLGSYRDDKTKDTDEKDSENADDKNINNEFKDQHKILETMFTEAEGKIGIFPVTYENIKRLANR